MKAKSAYRPKQKEMPAETPEMVAAALSEPAPEPEHKPEPADSALKVEPEPQPPPKEDAATAALRARISEIDRSAEVNRQYQAQAAQAQRPMSREELLDQWRQGGVSEANLEFLRCNPEMIDGWQLTYHCADEARRRGHEPDTPAHREATKEIFHRYLSEAKKTKELAERPTPKFFEPPPPPAPRQLPSKSALYSAPVSRETPTNRIYEAENDPRSVHLSPDQVEAARIAGVSTAEYAKQLLRMKRMQASGESQP
jgi:hypothetical protein